MKCDNKKKEKGAHSIKNMNEGKRMMADAGVGQSLTGVEDKREDKEEKDKEVMRE